MNGGRESKRAKLLAIAGHVIQKQGIRKTTLEDIGRAAGMAIPSMYYYFTGKEDLFRGVFSMLVDRVMEESHAAVDAAGTPPQKLQALWKVLFSAASRYGLVLDVTAGVKAEILVLAEDLIQELERRQRDLLRTILVEGIEQGVFDIEDLDLAATAITSAAIGLIIATAGEDRFHLFEGRIDVLGNLLIHGLLRR